MKRMFAHLFATELGTRRRFSAAVMQAIEAAIAAAERRTCGEIRFAVETALDLEGLRQDRSPRDSALDAFARLRVWDTELRNGVLIYLLMADRDVEIVADRGAAAKIPPAQWEAACRVMEEHFRAGRFQEGAVAGVAAVAALLEQHFPPEAFRRDELSNQPALL